MEHERVFQLCFSSLVAMLSLYPMHYAIRLQIKSDHGG
jgi:hypothetical protein